MPKRQLEMMIGQGMEDDLREATPCPPPNQQLDATGSPPVPPDGRREERSRQRAKRVRLSKERSARQGIHQGPAPLGYTRVSSPTTSGRRSPGQLIPDDVYAPIVREIFTRYAAGGWSHIRLVTWLNSDPHIPPPPHKVEWTCATIQAMLRNPLYCGLIRYNHQPEGRYERAAPGSAFVAPGQHPALVDRATFDRVAERRAAAFTRPGYQRHADSLGVGLFVCASCGGPMTPSHQEPGLFYRCSWYQRRKGTRSRVHTAMGYAGAIADEALLREVRRLRSDAWTPQAVRRLESNNLREQTGDGQRALAVTRDHLTDHAGLMNLIDKDPAPAQVATFRALVAEINGCIRTWEAEHTAPRPQVIRIRTLCALHGQLTATESSTRIDTFLAQGDNVGLRALVLDLVASARIVERLPERQPKWLQAEVTWKPDVQLLLDAGLLHLTPPSPPPEQSARVERHREAQRRYSARRRQTRVLRDTSYSGT